ncbi:YcxB family protein [Streptomyces sp. NPDC091376]|uniref:YcxB family protein n=1 Tax=Streptomyces sp. NPDC091376 TaxID=3365994 RepID=UPI00381C73D0
MATDVSVQFTYTVTLREISDGLKLQMRHSPAGRWVCRVLWVVGIFLGLVIVANVATRGINSPALGVLRFTVTVVLIMIACRWLMALALLGYARHLGEHRVTVDRRGIGTVSERHTNHTGWEFYGRCVESRRVFVLLTPDVWGAGVLLLPKRGLSAPQDTERMRELLAAALIDQRSVRAARRNGCDQPEDGPGAAGGARAT